MTTDKIVGDAIFGFISLPPHILAIIDTPEFQRLRMICQLGLTPFVYPTANHSRFEHSIGTYSLASKVIKIVQKQLRREKAEIMITDKEVKCVEIAALCHDIGHGPFSHFWDTQVLPSIDHSASKHEEQFDKVWKKLKSNNKKVQNMIKDNEFTEEDEDLISAIIKGTVIKGKEIFFGIVSNAESGLDVDKWDYLARDSTYLGHSTTNYQSDIERMLRFVRAIKDDEDGKWKLAFRDTENHNILRVFQLRDYMHRTAYKHRVVVGLDLLMLDGIKRCIKDKILDKNEIGTVDWILQNTDAIFWSNIQKIEEFKRILSRDLYKPIIEAIKYEEIKDVNKRIKEFQKHLEDENIGIINIRFGFSNFRLSSTESNPMLNVPFYKRGNDRKLYRYTKENIPSSLDANFNESRFIIFLTSLNDKDVSDNIVTTLSEYLTKDKWTVTTLV